MRNANRIHFADMDKLDTDRGEADEVFVTAVIIHEYDINNDEDIKLKLNRWENPDANFARHQANSNEQIDDIEYSCHHEDEEHEELLSSSVEAKNNGKSSKNNNPY